MKSYRSLLFCAVVSMTLGTDFARADDATITLDVTFDSVLGTAGTWLLSGRIDDTLDPADGQHGFAIVRSLLDGIDFGTNGDAITLASGIGAIDPIGENTPNERPAAIQLGSGTVDIVYTQDLSESETFPGSGIFNTVVFNVGNSGDTLLASGTFSAGSTPAFGQDNQGLFTDALFLPAGSTPFTSGSVDPDNVFTVVNLNFVTVTGDYNNNGIVDAADYTVWRDTFGSTTLLDADGNGNGTVDAADYGVWTSNFGNTSSMSTAVPEPSTLILTLAVASMALCRRRS